MRIMGFLFRLVIGGLRRATLLPDCIIPLKGAVGLVAPEAVNWQMDRKGIGFHRVAKCIAKIV
jgi:hypothetical protein